ncbi:nucleotidyl transferase AbiEii/AbiGii toxin family protein [Yinghuangia seranimata]|uniref:nucleotidyl transferase AbiEii/AbiGii toxin family protein n=1 Tax=Yinghuangia seranimata TaxID=408067 RepID=UPI00248C5783|nr:nucleotidyl transferase AbiEii/AbiGii toxin family protein [Yinghuangia seranimata]MDI2131672.1 nucleotidyl transferase AbiEii/AbiGii toxin family protein [Yinghuangia seranimata]
MTDMAEEQHPGTWEDIGWGPWPETAVVPQEPLDDDMRNDSGLPASLSVVRGEGIVQRPVFEPALQHYSKAMRAGEPQFASEELAARWHEARRDALDHVLAALAGSPWAEHLVLRGSVLLKAWYGAAAREPGDLDFVVLPATWGISEPRTERMLDDLAAAAQTAAEAVSDTSGVRIDAAGAARDEIWTYDRVPGRRMVLPWHADGLPSGSVQLDFVFNEELPAAPEFTTVPSRHTPEGHRILAATPELSLAWKLLWLVSDTYPQGKDLYDAVLLAEAVPLRASLLLETLVTADPDWAGRRIDADFLEGVGIDAEEFGKEHPEHGDEVDALMARLTAALAPTYAESAAVPPADGYTWRARLLAPRVERCREIAGADGMDAVFEFLQQHGFALAEGIVAAREVLGAERCSVEDAAATYAEWWNRTSPGYARWQCGPDQVTQAVEKVNEPV